MNEEEYIAEINVALSQRRRQAYLLVQAGLYWHRELSKVYQHFDDIELQYQRGGLSRSLASRLSNDLKRSALCIIERNSVLAERHRRLIAIIITLQNELRKL